MLHVGFDIAALGSYLTLWNGLQSDLLWPCFLDVIAAEAEDDIFGNPVGFLLVLVVGRAYR